MPHCCNGKLIYFWDHNPNGSSTRIKGSIIRAYGHWAHSKIIKSIKTTKMRFPKCIKSTNRFAFNLIRICHPCTGGPNHTRSAAPVVDEDL